MVRNAQIGYYAQDHEYEFENDLTVFDWMSQWKQEGTMSRRCAVFWGVCCSARRHQEACQSALRWREGPYAVRQADDGKTEHSGDGRTDQPPDMESIESLNMALEMYQGTLIFVSRP